MENPIILQKIIVGDLVFSFSKLDIINHMQATPLKRKDASSYLKLLYILMFR